MHPKTQFQISISSTSMDDQHQDQDTTLEHHDHINTNDQTILKADLDLDDHGDNGYDLDQYGGNMNGENRSNYERDSFNYYTNDPPGSYAVCQSKVSDWLDRNTFIELERNPSVKFACSKNQDPSQTPSSRRSVSSNQQPKLSIIGFRKTPVHQIDGKAKNAHNRVENVKLFRNRSEPGRDYCVLITEPLSPRVSCSGRVGSVKVVHRRKAGVWRSFKAAVSTLLHMNRAQKQTASK